VNAALRRLNPAPEFICFIGDHIQGEPEDREVLHGQWRYWLDHEMAWLDQKATPLYHTTSNHNTPNVAAEAIWREIFPNLPQNGPPGQEGLSYYVQRDNLLLVCTNSAYSALGGTGHVEHEWLDQVLTQHAGASYKLVLGHYPIWPVNGYADYPIWRVVPDQGQAFWDVLVKHRVVAYLCSHVIAFDVQAHEGVLQITTGGAGTNYGPSNFMPGPVEYLHLVQAAIDAQGLRYQVIDTDGRVREWLRWPFELPHPAAWQRLAEGVTDLSAQRSLWQHKPGTARVFAWRFSGNTNPHPPLHASLERRGNWRGATSPLGKGGLREVAADDQTLLCAWTYEEGPAVLWIGLERGSNALKVSLSPESGGGEQMWYGPALSPSQPSTFDLAIHTGMGPGGVLWRNDEQSPWSSLLSTSACGAEHMPAPERWALGHAQSGTDDRPFQGSALRATWVTADLHL
jgi:hypothetical protein